LKAFHFSLERVLEWRASQLLIEEAELRRLSEQASALELSAASLEQSRLASEDKVRHASYVDGWDLKALEAYRRQTQKQREVLQARLKEALKLVVAQREKLLAARREHRLIEKLRERRLVEWTTESNKEIEQNAAESYLAKFNREK
jgi:hypothetical protein